VTTFLGWPVEPVKSVEPVKNGKISDFIFYPANGPTGNGLNLFKVENNTTKIKIKWRNANAESKILNISAKRVPCEIFKTRVGHFFVKKSEGQTL